MKDKESEQIINTYACKCVCARVCTYNTLLINRLRSIHLATGETLIMYFLIPLAPLYRHW